MSYDTWQEALAGLVKDKGLEDSELGDISKRASAPGSTDSRGTVGARGPLTHVSEILGLHRTDVSTTRDDGLNTYQGQCRAISSRSRGARGEGFTLTVYFDSKTSSRLKESLFSRAGKVATGEIEYSSIEVTLVLPST